MKFTSLVQHVVSTGIYNLKDVLRMLQVKGYKSSKTAFSNMIRNPLYAGLVYLKPYKEEREQFIEGIHEPIVSKALFNKVQDHLNRNNKQQGVGHKKINPNFPLRGFMTCPKCNKPLSASISTGRHKKYAYYHCFSPCDVRIKKEDAHAWFNHFLSSISLDDNSYTLLVEIIKDEFDKMGKQNGMGPKHYEKLKNLENKLLKIQDLYIDGDLTKEEYTQNKERHTTLINELKECEEHFFKKQEVFNLYKEGLKSIQNIENQYIKIEIDHKRRLIGSIFPKKFQFENKKVRTSDLNPIFRLIHSFTRDDGGRNKKRTGRNTDPSCVVAGAGLEPTTFGL